MVTRTKKIFVGGLSAPSTLDDVKNYFEQFGRVSEIFKFMNIFQRGRGSFRNGRKMEELLGIKKLTLKLLGAQTFQCI